MAKNDDTIKLSGVVAEVLPNTQFKVLIQGLEDKTHVVLAYLCGKMKTNNITVLAGDKVDLEVSTYDINRGRITFRYKN